MDILVELNALAEKLQKELIEAQRLAVKYVGVTLSYDKGRAVELERWLASTEDLISKIIERREAKREAQK